MIATLPGNWDFYLQLPLVIVVISLVYSATRYDQWSHIVQEAFRWGVRMAVFLLSISVVLYFMALLI